MCAELCKICSVIFAIYNYEANFAMIWMTVRRLGMCLCLTVDLNLHNDIMLLQYDCRLLCWALALVVSALRVR